LRNREIISERLKDLIIAALKTAKEAFCGHGHGLGSKAPR